MEHPDPKCRAKQEEFINQCPENLKEYHRRFFRIGNATYIYHQQPKFSKIFSVELYNEWLKSLPSNIRADMQKKGYESCKSVLSFTRYVNERNDIGMDAWMKEHLSPEDFEFYKNKK